MPVLGTAGKCSRGSITTAERQIPFSQVQLTEPASPTGVHNSGVEKLEKTFI